MKIFGRLMKIISLLQALCQAFQCFLVLYVVVFLDFLFCFCSPRPSLLTVLDLFDPRPPHHSLSCKYITFVLLNRLNCASFAFVGCICIQLVSLLCLHKDTFIPLVQYLSISAEARQTLCSIFYVNLICFTSTIICHVHAWCTWNYA